MPQILELNSNTFVSTLKATDLPVLLDFWAPWCPPCRQLSPVLERIAERYEGKLKVFKINVDQNEALSQQFKIASIPALVLMRKGELLDTFVGFRTEHQLAEQLDSILASSVR
jgi:thioredoxin 1